MKLNKKQTKVSLDTKYQFLGLGGSLIQFGLPFWYIAWRYDLFTFKNEAYAVTGWGIIGLVIISFFTRNKIKQFITDYNTNLSVTAERAKSGHIFISLAMILLVTQFFIDSFLWLFGIVAVSNYLSLILYAPYDNQIIEKKELQKLLDEDKLHDKISNLKSLQKK